jgi:hypothetical protein
MFKFIEGCMAEFEVLTLVFQSIKGFWDVALRQLVSSV